MGGYARYEIPPIRNGSLLLCLFSRRFTKAPSDDSPAHTSIEVPSMATTTIKIGVYCAFLAEVSLDGGVFMVIWQEWPSENEPRQWDESLTLASDRSGFQCHGWGEYKRRDGWAPLRLVAQGSEGAPLAMAQILVRRYTFGICLCWIPGGPVFGFSKAHSRVSLTVEGLLQALQQRFKHLYVRLQPCAEHSPEFSYSMVQAGLRRPTSPLSSGYTVSFKLDLSEPDFLAKMTAKHRYYLKQSRTSGISWEISTGPTAISTLVALNLEVARRAQVDSMATTEQKVRDLCSAMQHQSLILIGRQGTRAACACLALVFGKRAFYLMAGTNELGRTSSASYAMFGQLIDALKGRGITELDFGGIDPTSQKARGVNHYKLGFGGRITQYLGEWEWASNRFLGKAVNFVIGRTMGRT